MSKHLYPKLTSGAAERRRSLAPEVETAFRHFGQAAIAVETLDDCDHEKPVTA